jgi:FKBP12-rapamycin complex-associated protein
MNITAASLDEFYPSVTLTMLMRILKDPTLSAQHNLVVKVSRQFVGQFLLRNDMICFVFLCILQAMTFIFNSLGPKFVPFVEQVIPCFLNCIREGDPSSREFLFKNLGEIIGMVRLHIRPFLTDIFDLIQVSSSFLP